jgi:hypothetical protein
MSQITQKDIIILLKAVIQMANIDGSFDPREKAFFEKLVYKGKINSTIVEETILPNQDNIDDLSQELSSLRAKKAFLLTLATMALADFKIDPREKKMLNDLTKSLNVGQIKLSDLTFEECEEMALKIISDSQKQVRSKLKKQKLANNGAYLQQLSDIDILTR